MALTRAPRAVLTDRVLEAAPGRTIGELEDAALRAVLALLATLFVALGVVVLTGPAAVLFTVALWLCAAALLGLIAFGRFETGASSDTE
jgi:hypothetical protein